MDFNEYCKTNKFKPNKNTNNSKTNAQTKENKQEDVKNLYDKYSKLSHDELMQELLEQTSQKRAEGSLNNQKLLEIQQKLSPLLNDSQNKNLQEIIERLKR